MAIPKFRTGYDHDFGPRGDIDFGDEPSLAIQSAKDECDINCIIDRANRGIQPQFTNLQTPVYGDVSSVQDYQTALNLITEAQGHFDSLPASVRDRFNNNPATLLKFLNNPQNRKEAESLGLVQPPEPEPAPTSASSTSTTAKEPAAAAKQPAPAPEPKTT